MQVDDGTIAWVGVRGEGPAPQDVIALGGFLLPAAADRHVHIGMPSLATCSAAV